MARIHLNGIDVGITAQLLSGGGTVNVTAGTGALFAAAATPNYVVGTLHYMSGGKSVAQEIVKITARSTDALTITRAQEGTSARQFEVATTRLVVGATAASFDAPDIVGPATITVPSATGPVRALKLHNPAVAVGDGATIDFYAGAGNINARIKNSATATDAGSLILQTANGSAFADALTITSAQAATFASSLKATGAFGCNAAAVQTAYASGGALAAYGAGANGFDSGANASALHALVVKIRAALVANGIMS